MQLLNENGTPVPLETRDLDFTGSLFPSAVTSDLSVSRVSTESLDVSHSGTCVHGQSLVGSVHSKDKRKSPVRSPSPACWHTLLSDNV